MDSLSLHFVFSFLEKLEKFCDLVQRVVSISHSNWPFKLNNLLKGHCLQELSLSYCHSFMVFQLYCGAQSFASGVLVSLVS